MSFGDFNSLKHKLCNKLRKKEYRKDPLPAVSCGNAIFSRLKIALLLVFLLVKFVSCFSISSWVGHSVWTKTTLFAASPKRNKVKYVSYQCLCWKPWGGCCFERRMTRGGDHLLTRRELNGRWVKTTDRERGEKENKNPFCVNLRVCVCVCVSQMKKSARRMASTSDTGDSSSE